MKRELAEAKRLLAKIRARIGSMKEGKHTWPAAERERFEAANRQALDHVAEKLRELDSYLYKHNIG